MGPRFRKLGGQCIAVASCRCLRIPCLSGFGSRRRPYSTPLRAIAGDRSLTEERAYILRDSYLNAMTATLGTRNSGPDRVPLEIVDREPMLVDSSACRSTWSQPLPRSRIGMLGK